MRIHSWNPGDVFKQPERMPTVRFECYHCHKITEFPTQAVADKEAKYWRERHEKHMAMMNSVIRRCHLLHGSDPMTEWFQAELIKLREEMGMDEGDEWKRGKG